MVSLVYLPGSGSRSVGTFLGSRIRIRIITYADLKHYSLGCTPDLEDELAGPVADGDLEPLVPHRVQRIVLHSKVIPTQTLIRVVLNLDSFLPCSICSSFSYVIFRKSPKKVVSHSILSCH